MKKLIFVALVISALFVFTACSDSEASANGESDSLIVYSPNSDGLLNATVPLFEEKYGVEVEVISAGTGELFKRIEGEQNDPQGDVIYGGSLATYMLHPDLFETYTSANNADIISMYQNKDGYITPYVLDGSVLVLNKTLTAGMDIKGYADLIDPSLEGKIVSANPAASSSAYAHLTNMLLAMGGYENQDAWDYVKELYSLAVTIDSSSSVWRGVRDGEYAIGLSYEDPSAKLVQDGADVEVVYMEEGAVFLPAGSAVIKGAKNMVNAKLFIDFITSKEIQDSFGLTLTNRPVYNNAQTADYMTPFNELSILEEDTPYVSENKDDIVNKFQEIYVDIQG